MDRLEVRVSGDCGATWTTLFNKNGAALSTRLPMPAAFNPSATQWRNEIVNLNSFAGQNDVIIKFVATGNGGNNLFIDDINIVNTTGLSEISNIASFNVYPNPMTSTSTIDLSLLQAAVVSLEITNVVGEKIVVRELGELAAGASSFTFGSELSSGVYFVTLLVDNQKITKMITVSK